LFEANGSKRMGIIGEAAMIVFIYSVIFRKQITHPNYIIILAISGVIFSGGRSTLLSFLFILYFIWAVKNKVLVRSFFYMLIGIVLFIGFTLSPLILYIPEKMQRVFIIFPSEFYSGALKELARSSAASSSNFRMNMWVSAIPDIINNMWLGNGFGIVKGNYSFSNHDLSAFQKIKPQIMLHDIKANGNLHNTFISILYMMGLPALLSFIYVFLKLILKTYSISIKAIANIDYLQFFVLILLNFLISSFMGDVYLSMDFFIFLAIIIKSVAFLKEAPIENTISLSN
jgi:O-antigen ligase